jgi:hypothetical protein
MCRKILLTITLFAVLTIGLASPRSANAWWYWDGYPRYGYYYPGAPYYQRGGPPYYQGYGPPYYQGFGPPYTSGYGMPYVLPGGGVQYLDY